MGKAFFFFFPVLVLGYRGISLKKAVCSDDKLLESTVTNTEDSESFFFFLYNSSVHASCLALLILTSHISTLIKR